MRYFTIYIIISFLAIGCYSQSNNPTSVAFKKVDLELNQVYQEYYKDRQNFGHEKDSLLPVFENKLKETLSKKEFYGMSFDSLTKTKQVSVIVSEDQKLRIYSWDTFNMGTWKQYNSIYQYKNNGQIYTEFLSEKENSTGNYINFTDGFHYKIYDIDANTYLIEGYGTHGHGQEFYTLLLMEMATTEFKERKESFNGKDKLIVHKPRGNSQKKAIAYNPNTKEIKYLEHLEDKDTGFIKPTDKTITLIYTKGRFMKKE